MRSHNRRVNGQIGVTVDLKLSQSEDRWKVDLCTVWLSAVVGKFIQSGEWYRSDEEAITEMKKRAMNYIAERGALETEDQVEWHVMLSVDRVSALMGPSQQGVPL